MYIMDCEVQKKTENMVEYKKNYYEMHKEEYKQPEICDICKAKYQLWNKSKHKKSKKHMMVMQEIEIEQLKKQLELRN